MSNEFSTDGLKGNRKNKKFSTCEILNWIELLLCIDSLHRYVTVVMA